MRKLVFIAAIGIGALAGGAAFGGQAPPAGAAAPPPASAPAKALTRVLGEVIALDPDSRLMTVKADAGQNYTLVFEDLSNYLLVPPGEKDLQKATPIGLADINRGDRVFAQGYPFEDGHTLPARRVIVMSKAAIEKKHDTEREEWQRRGVLGTVSEVKAKENHILLQVRRGPMGTAPVTLHLSDKTKFRRYAADSVKFADAQSSSLSELKAGDQLRALGQRSEDGNSYTADQVVFGSFRTVAGTVAAVTPDSNEIKLKALGGDTITVVLNKDSQLRRFPKEFAAMMAQRMFSGSAAGATGGRPGGAQGGMPGASGAAPGGAGAALRPQGAPNAAGPGGPGAPEGAARQWPGAGRPAGAGSTVGAAPGGMPGGTAGGRRATDDLLDRLPPLTLAEVKPGDTVMVFSTAGKSASKVTAIAFVAGMEAFLAAMPVQSMRQAGAGGMSLGLPGGMDMGMGMGIGLP